jgi:hypothetical protein
VRLKEEAAVCVLEVLLRRQSAPSLVPRKLVVGVGSTPTSPASARPCKLPLAVARSSASGLSRVPAPRSTSCR